MFTESERKQVSTIILGGSGSGKTNYVNIMVMNPEFIYDKIYVYTPNKHEWKIERLNSFFYDMSKEVGYNVLEIRGPDDLIFHPPINKTIIIFEDTIPFDEYKIAELMDMDNVSSVLTS